MKTIKFCSNYQSNAVINKSTVIESFIFTLNQSEYYTEKDNNKIHFNRHSSLSTDRSKNTTEGSIILKSGTIFFDFNQNNINMCGMISLTSIYFRAFMFSFIFYSVYYYYSSNDILKIAIYFGLSFIFITIFSIIFLKARTLYINKSII